MRKTIICLSVLSAIATAGIAAPAHAGAVALCIEKDKNRAGNWYDSEYFLRNGRSKNVDGFEALQAAKADHRRNYDYSTPYCRHNGETLKNGGYFIVLQSLRTKDLDGAHSNRWALGFGLTREAALADALSELRRRDPLWSLKEHGYKITDEDDI